MRESFLGEGRNKEGGRRAEHGEGPVAIGDAENLERL